MALTPIPESYLKPIEQAGKVIRIDYKSNTYDDNHEELDKFAFVYLPYGYDESKKYNILYCLHGGGGEIEVYFGTEEKPAPIKLTLDNMIANGDIDPIIAVSPTYYTGKKFAGGMNGAAGVVQNFKIEQIKDLIPAVEGRFSTYAESTDPEGIKASRDHRGYTGYSMGALSTWSTFADNLDYFRYFMPMSGDFWVNGTGGPMSNIDNATGASKKLEETAARYGKDGFRVYAVTGDKDIAFGPMTKLMAGLKENAPTFQFITEDNAEGNISFRAEPEATHDYVYMPLYFYNALPTFWNGKPVF